MLSEESFKGYQKRERWFVFTLTFCICLYLAFSVHNRLFVSGSATSQNGVTNPAIRYAPEGYRILIPTIVHVIRKIHSFHDEQWILAILDFIFCSLTLVFLHQLIVCRVSAEKHRERFLRTALFFAFIPMSINWIVPWGRPETTPASFYIAAVIFCQVNVSSTRRQWFYLVVLTLFQAFARADIPFFLGFSIALLALLGTDMTELGGRVSSFCKGASIIIISGGVQIYLQFVRYPHLSYNPSMPIVSFRYNLSAHHLSTAFVALLPFVIVGVLAFRVRSMGAVDRVIMVAGGLYFPLFCIVALIDEVRVYVPFLMAFSVPAVNVVTQQILGEDR